MLMYIELKSGYSDDGPAWIGRVKQSKSGRTLYFNNKIFQRIRGFNYNYYDIETWEHYWISGLKRNGQDRHWAGHSKITIQKSVLQEYLDFRKSNSLDKNLYELADIAEVYATERHKDIANRKTETEQED